MGKDVLAEKKEVAQKKEAAHTNDDCVSAWEQNAYHYACDPYANY